MTVLEYVYTFEEGMYAYGNIMNEIHALSVGFYVSILKIAAPHCNRISKTLQKQLCCFKNILGYLSFV